MGLFIYEMGNFFFILVLFFRLYFSCSFCAWRALSLIHSAHWMQLTIANFFFIIIILSFMCRTECIRRIKRHWRWLYICSSFIYFLVFFSFSLHFVCAVSARKYHFSYDHKIVGWVLVEVLLVHERMSIRAYFLYCCAMLTYMFDSFVARCDQCLFASNIQQRTEKNCWQRFSIPFLRPFCNHFHVFFWFC